MRRSLATILVTWDPKTISGIKGEFIGYDLEYKLIEVNGIPKDDALWTSLMFSCYQSKTEFNLTDLLPFARYEIKMAVITSEDVGKYSEAVYGGWYFGTLHVSLILFTNMTLSTWLVLAVCRTQVI